MFKIAAPGDELHRDIFIMATTKLQELPPRVQVQYQVPNKDQRVEYDGQTPYGDSPAFTTARSQDTRLSTTGDEDEPVREKWNEPRINMYRTFAAFWAFVVMGMNDGMVSARGIQDQPLT